MRFKEIKNLIEQQEDTLFEIKMTGKNLSKLAKEIPGVKVGLEFEMIVPNTENPDDQDIEPDYDMDESVSEIDDAVRFFDDGDYNGRNEIRRLREAMNEDYWAWRSEKLDESWYDNGFEFFMEYLDREDPFDPADYQDQAEEYVRDNNPDLDPTSEEFKELTSERLRELNTEYYQEKWDEQDRNYDYAREEYESDHEDDYTESDWLDDQGILTMSDVESQYGHVTWPYYRSTGGDGESDIEGVALDFMNAMGMDSVAYSSSYHGSYKKWVGNGWILVGSNKPDDCFTIEPDGSLDGDNSSDAGLEFVSPPIPLEDIGTVMQKVQNWASNYGAYTGKNNKTSMHTNISIPGYDLGKLDYLKAALLLGDEYVLREFDRIGNTYAKPAIEKVRQLVKSNPEKAQELLDKMKSQLNAEASKLIHSGITDKFTSINTKDNRIEFRSPGGDYLSDIADNPKKLQDTINRMVVTMDAALDPNKYKQEYQKKLYKVLTGQGVGREAATGKKQEMKASDKDLLNIFSRYAAGELPKAALKSFVRQAQLQRNVAKGKTSGKMWWNVKYNGQRIEVVADNVNGAKQIAAKEWGIPALGTTLDQMTAEPLRPYVDKSSGPTLNGRPSNPDGDWVITDPQEPGKIFYRYMASDHTDAWNVLQQWIAANPGREWKYSRDSTQRLGQPSGSQSTQSTTDAIRQAVGRNIAAQSAQNQGNWGIWINANDRFANQPGSYSRNETPPLYRFPSREAAEQWIEQQRAARPNMRTDIEVREIEPANPIPGSTLDLPRPQATQTDTVNYELYNRTTGAVIDTFPARNDDEAMVRLNDYRNFGAGQSDPESFGIRRGPGVTNTAQQSSVNNLTPRGPGPWELASVNNNQVYFNPEHTNRGAAETEARTWIQQMGLDPAEFVVRTREGVSSTDAAQGGIITTANEPTTGSQVGQTYNPSGTGSFTGQWLILNPNNQVIYRFGGIGNAQSDANRIAMAWLTQNPRQMVDGVTVVPVMG